MVLSVWWIRGGLLSVFMEYFKETDFYQFSPEVTRDLWDVYCEEKAPALAPTAALAELTLGAESLMKLAAPAAKSQRAPAAGADWV